MRYKARFAQTRVGFLCHARVVSPVIGCHIDRTPAGSELNQSKARPVSGAASSRGLRWRYEQIGVGLGVRDRRVFRTRSQPVFGDYLRWGFDDPHGWNSRVCRGEETEWSTAL
jgi:hypothetical protein